jgi:xanthine dehydrogenase accessory factor
MKAPTPVEVLAAAQRALGEDGRVVLCQIVRSQGSTPGKPGWKLLVRRGGPYGNLGGGAFEALVAHDAAAKLADEDARSEVKRYYFTETAVRGEATGMVCGGMSEVFLEVIVSAPLFVVCGGGPVGQALAQAGDLAGFDCLVVEDRAEFRAAERFPAGTRFAAVDRGYADDYLAPFAGRDLYAAVVTRCWETDVAALASVLRQAPPRLRYLGLMGSKRKIARVRREVAARGHDLAAVTLHAPIGLPIGGDSPGEIAIGILAEVLACRHGAALAGGEAPAAEPALAAVHA